MKYTVTGKSVLITGGVLTLSKAQASDRAHCLKELDKKNQYEVIKSVTFKHGEVFGFDGKLPKGAGAEADADSKAEAKAKAEAEAKAKAEAEASAK